MVMLIRIQSWLIKPKVWRFVCFVSSVVGLLCHAFSSSFNHLLGKWTWWKILLYIVLSFIICLAVLFTKGWEHSTSPRLEAHMAFFVLMITSVYSFFLDKVVKGKPDAYSLISSASFAIMSLGLSRLSHYGFEVDLLYFFSGVLVVQLMKINLWLVIVGACFSYSLITLRCTLNASGYLGLQVEDQVVIEISSHSQETTLNASQADSSQASTDTANSHLMIIMPQEVDYFPENDNLVFLAPQIDSHSLQGSSDSGLLMARSMDCLEELKKENGNVINVISKHLEEYLKANAVNQDQITMRRDSNLVVDALPSGIINDLNETVRLMVTEGFKEEFCRAYSRWRRKFLEECLSVLGLQVEELNLEDNDSIMDMIENWIKASNVAVTLLFPNEMRLRHCVFNRSTFSADIVFTEVCTELAISLLNFANMLATWTWSHSQTPSSGIIVNVFTTLENLKREFEFQFLDQHRVTLRNKARRVQKSLGIFMELENLTYGFKAQDTIPGGGLHPFTNDVVNYIREVSINNIREVSINKDSSLRLGKLSQYGQVDKIIERLESFLEAKSKNYNNPTLGYFFIMNNRRFIEKEAKLYGLETIFGEDWMQNNTRIFQENFEHYQRSSWNKIIDFLKMDINDLEPNVTAELMKDKLHAFNKCFDEISNIQSTWFVFDEQLREKIIKSIENILLPAYGHFVGRFQEVLGKPAYDYIKYGIFSIQDRLNNLFLITTREKRSSRSYGLTRIKYSSGQVYLNA